MTAGRLHALVLLAWAFLVMIAKRIFGREGGGLVLFRTNYEGDHLSPLTATERAEVASYSACIACGRCNVGDGPRMIAAGGAYPGTMALMLASSRSIPDFAAASQALRWISDDELAEKELICPTRVPMRRVAAFIRAHASRRLPG